MSHLANVVWTEEPGTVHAEWLTLICPGSKPPLRQPERPVLYRPPLSDRLVWGFTSCCEHRASAYEKRSSEGLSVSPYHIVPGWGPLDEGFTPLKSERDLSLDLSTSETAGRFNRSAVQ